MASKVIIPLDTRDSISQRHLVYLNIRRLLSQLIYERLEYPMVCSVACTARKRLRDRIKMRKLDDNSPEDFMHDMVFGNSHSHVVFRLVLHCISLLLFPYQIFKKKEDEHPGITKFTYFLTSSMNTGMRLSLRPDSKYTSVKISVKGYSTLGWFGVLTGIVVACASPYYIMPLIASYKIQLIANLSPRVIWGSLSILMIFMTYMGRMMIDKLAYSSKIARILNRITCFVEHNVPGIEQENTSGTKQNIISLARDGDIGALRSALNVGLIIDRKTPNGDSALHVSARYGHPDFCEMLMALGADPNARNNVSMTPLHLAARYGKTDAVQILLECDADMTLKNRGDKTPRDLAVMYSHTDCIEAIDAFIPREVQIDSSQKMSSVDWVTAVNKAIRKDDLVAFNRLLASDDCDVNASLKSGRTALYFATLNEKESYVNLLLDAGADIMRADTNGSTALHVVFSNEHYGILDRFITQGIDVNIVETAGNTLLHQAIQSGNGDQADIVLELGADINQKNNMGDTALNIAYRKNDPTLIRLLRDRGGQTNFEQFWEKQDAA